MQEQIAQIEKWLSGLTGVADVRLEPEMPYDLSLNGLPVWLVWVPEAETLMAAVVVGDLSITAPDSAAKIVRSAMESNYQWNGTDGGAIGLNDQGLVVFQNRWFLPAPSERTVIEGITRMVVAAEDLMKTYLTFDAAADIPPTALRV